MQCLNGERERDEMSIPKTGLLFSDLLYIHWWPEGAI